MRTARRGRRPRARSAARPPRSSSSKAARTGAGQRLAVGGSGTRPRVALAVPGDVGHADAPGRQDPGERMQHDVAHAERARQRADVLAGGAAEADQRAAARIDAARDRHLRDRLAPCWRSPPRRSPPRSRPGCARGPPRAARAAARRARASTGSRRSGNGKRSGCTRPSARFASVSASSRAPALPVAERTRLGARALGPDA